MNIIYSIIKRLFRPGPEKPVDPLAHMSQHQLADLPPWHPPCNTDGGQPQG